MEHIIFTQEELSDLSNGLLALLRDAGEAEKLVADELARNAIRAYAGRIRSLNDKLCGMMAG